jgi:hypothetical protein
MDITQPPASADPAAPIVVSPAAPAAVAPPVAPAVDPRVNDLMAIVSEDVARDLASVPENVRATVRSLAGDDPIAQRRVLATLRANGVTGPVVLPPGATTAVPSGQPAPAADVSPDAAHLAEYERARTVAPQYAAAYRSQHAASIARALAARPVTH